MSVNNDEFGAPLKKGYILPRELRQIVRESHETAFWWTAGTALFDHVIAVAAAVLAALAVMYLPAVVAALAALLAIVVIARQVRALECLVHEASHFNWSRRNRTLNDLAATVVACLPSGASISAYRESHFLHHGRFATSSDPDRLRYEELGLEEINRSNPLAFAWDILLRLPRYQLGWIRSAWASPALIILPLAWPFATLFFPLTAATSAPLAEIATALWLVAYVVALPVIRLVAESSEHAFRGASTVFAATITNLGWLQRALVHPHHDGYHTVHHLWPGVPHHRLKRLHRTLASTDPAFASSLRYRMRVVQNYAVGLDRPCSDGERAGEVRSVLSG